MSKKTVASKKKIQKVLIANRGEIACRVMHTCDLLGKQSVAVYSEADKNLRHVRVAKESYEIGPGPSSESYLKIEKILEAAKKSKSDAIHPGYGFLSENAKFAKAVKNAGLIWIGPNAETIDALGNKIAAKKVAEKAGVPTLSWAMLKEGWSEKELISSAKKVGYPLILKAAAGGGGRGMRLVQKESELVSSAQSATREALGAFSSGEIFLESYCSIARHIEVQVFGDQYGNVITFGERDCSTQRRHQKVIEEAPAANLSDSARSKLWDAARKLALSVGYVNAGTCEFLVDKKENIYFLEMNTRLQVEHPVTEIVWGVDLVELQLRIAEGENLNTIFKDSKLSPRGHSIELRLYAEDPANQFMPSPGKIENFSWPCLPGIRMDFGYETGDEIPIFYDAMLAKLIASAPSRESAIALVKKALEETNIEGVRTNLNYLQDILDQPKFKSAEVYTQFLLKEMGDWKTRTKTPKKQTAPKSVPASNTEPLSPLSPWQAFGSGTKTHQFQGHKAEQNHSDAGVSTELPGGPLVSQYPGKILKVNVKKGDKVKSGTVVVVCESMKMEFSYSASSDTKVKNVFVNEGQIITAGTTLVEWETKA